MASRNIRLITAATAALWMVAAPIWVAEAEVEVQPQPLTWEACLAEAAEQHPDMISAREQIRQAEAEAAIAYGGFYPRLGADASATLREEPETSYSAGLSASLMLFDGFGTLGSAQAADATVRQARARLDQAAADTRYTLRAAFVNLLKTQELISLTEIIANRRRQNLDLVRLRYQAGREHEGSLKTAEAELAQAAFEVGQARRALRLGHVRLAEALGREPGEALTVAGALSVSDTAETPDFTAMIKTLPAVREAKAEEDAAEARLRSSYGAWYPELKLGASAGLQGDALPMDSDAWSAGMSLSWPIFSGGSRAAGVRKAEASLARSRESLRSARTAQRVALEDAWNTRLDARGQLGVRAKYLAAAEDRAKIANGQYSAGLIAFDDWTIIEDNLVNARKNHLNARAQALLAEAQWLQAEGGGF